MSELVNIIPDHPWVGALLWDTSFLGVVKEVHKSWAFPDGYFYVRYVYNNGEHNSRYVRNSCVVSDGVLRV